MRLACFANQNFSWSVSNCAQQASELMIPTDETARQVFFLEAFLSHGKPLLFIGPTGTGKSAITNNYIVGMPREKYDSSRA